MMEQLNAGPSVESREDFLERKREAGAHQGRRRLVADRQQHDEAEKHSERTRLDRERGRESGPDDDENVQIG
jgi:hypothetical protein